MYSRAPRHLHPESRRESALVGPGSYEPHQERRQKDGNAPFLSHTKRETFLDISDQAVVAPGPCHYSPRIPGQRRVTGGNSLASTTKRFINPVKNDVPGPGQYFREASQCQFGKSYPPPGMGSGTKLSSSDSLPAAANSSARRVPRRGQLIYKRHPTAPSIPSARQSLGYDEGPDGKLHAQELPERDTTMGPAYYKPVNEPTGTEKKYKGVHFSKLTSKRFQFKGKEGPSPSCYAHQQNALPQRPASSPPSKPPLEAGIPRYHEMVQKQAIKKDVPPPGKYDIGGSLEKKPPGIEPLTTVPFGSQTKRFMEPKRHDPSPCSYNDPRTALEELKKPTGNGYRPFGQSSARFKEMPTKRLPPPPSQYDLRDTKSIEEECRRRAERSLQPATALEYGFGSSVSRNTALADRTKISCPGPGHYDVSDIGNDSSSLHGNSGLHSIAKPQPNFVTAKTKRLDDPPKPTPAPGYYNVAESFDRTHGKQSMAKPITVDAAVRQTAFTGVEPRFNPLPLAAVLPQPDPDNPSPGAYNTQKWMETGKNSKNSLMVTTTERFKVKPNGVPGPGAYKFSAEYEHTVLRGTFNTLLDNPLETLPANELNRQDKPRKVTIGIA